MIRETSLPRSYPRACQAETESESELQERSRSDRVVEQKFWRTWRQGPAAFHRTYNWRDHIYPDDYVFRQVGGKTKKSSYFEKIDPLWVMQSMMDGNERRLHEKTLDRCWAAEKRGRHIVYVCISDKHKYRPRAGDEEEESNITIKFKVDENDDLGFSKMMKEVLAEKKRSKAEQEARSLGVNDGGAPDDDDDLLFARRHRGDKEAFDKEAELEEEVDVEVLTEAEKKALLIDELEKLSFEDLAERPQEERDLLYGKEEADEREDGGGASTDSSESDDDEQMLGGGDFASVGASSSSSVDPKNFSNKKTTAGGKSGGQKRQLERRKKRLQREKLEQEVPGCILCELGIRCTNTECATATELKLRKLK